MPKLLMRTTGASAEEVDGLMELLQKQGIVCYTTDAGRWRLGVDGLWLTHDEDAAKARQLAGEFQYEFSKESRADFERRLAEGTAPTFASQLRQRPLVVIGALLAVAAIAMLSLLPLLLG
ncbi:DUF6164 family protein [uncultured Gilvimarinus sp.]|uniref:DUF6164 family protein n=1 Tax=uncultured Gilvimarinus sp. TaxID=1689143 RepID=UPI0030ECDA82